MDGLMSLWDWDALRSQSPTLLAPGTSFVENSFSVDQGLGGWFRDDPSALDLDLLCTIFLI